MVNDMINAIKMSAGDEDKFQTFTRRLKDLGDKFVSEGVCQSYKIRFLNGSKIPKLFVDTRPNNMDNIARTVYTEAISEYHALLHSCKITDDEYDDSYGGIRWVFEGVNTDEYDGL